MTKQTSENNCSSKSRSFEESLLRLDEIIAVLEKDNVPLDDLMKLYEEGVGLLRDCNTQLEQAEQTVKMLKISPDGQKAHLVSFDAGENE